MGGCSQTQIDLDVIIIIKSNTYDITIIAKNPSNNKLILFKLLESKTTL